MTKEERDYQEITQQVADSLFLRASVVAGEAVKRGVRYAVACDAIYGAQYQGVFGAALQSLKNAGKVARGMTIKEAWGDREVHELVAHDIIRKIFSCLDLLDPRYVWSINILKKKRKL